MSDDTKDAQSLRQEVNRLNKLLQIGRVLSSDIHLENIMERVTEECALMVGARAAFVFILNRDKGKLWTMLIPKNRIFRLAENEGIEGWVATHREYVISDKPHEDSRFSSKLERELGYTIENMAVLPLVNYRGDTIGVFEAINAESGIFSSQDYLLLHAAAAQIAMNIENSRLYQDLRRTFNSLTEVMATTIDAKHPISKGHSRRVAKYAVGIAREMGLIESQVEQIRIASLLHDYGKIGIPDSILMKEGKLSDEEFEAIKEHARITHDIVSRVHFAEELSEVPTIASCHHERWDGEGYPFRMAGEAIPLGSRIIAVADTFDAITTEREYRGPQSYDVAASEIQAETGTHFDPIAVSYTHLRAHET